MSDTTPFETRAEILSEVWLNYKGDEQFSDFIEYNDLGLPLAYAISTEIVEPSPKAQMFIDETFMLLLASTGHETDTGFESLADLFNL